MRILIFGAGAIGSVLGGLLAKAGQDVTLLGRARHLDQVRQQGLTVTGLWGTHHLRTLATALTVSELRQPETFDWVFVCVKAYQTAEAADALRLLLGPATLVCAFQNGLGNYETLTQRLPPSRVALGRIIFGAELEPGQVRVTVCADDVLVGAPDPAFPSEALDRLVDALRAGGIPARRHPAILTALWGKVLYNCALNGLSTLLEVPYGRLPERSHVRCLMAAVIEEAYQIAAAHRVALEPPEASAYLAVLFEQLIPATAAHQSSMLQDVRRGRPTEIEALNGALVRLAEPAGLAAPANALITRLVHAKERFLGVAPAPGL